jgi:hypothetical protein
MVTGGNEEAGVAGWIVSSSQGGMRPGSAPR